MRFERFRTATWRTAVIEVPRGEDHRAASLFRPVTQDGLPLSAESRNRGRLLATGDNVWGILNAPATGKALAELIADGVASSTDFTPFDPIRLRPLDPAVLQRS
jgi:glycine/D-amino acid oxidase-like deaminating enzyme